MRMRLVLLFVGVGLALVAAGCGDGSDDTASDDTASDDTEVTSTTTAAAAESSTTSASTETTTPTPGESTESTARVTIDGVVYEFGDHGPPATCSPDFFGGFFAVLYSEDLSENFTVELWNEGAGDGQQTTAAGMKVDADGETLDLEANPEQSWPAAEAGTSYVGPFAYEGNRASGTIHFINSEVAYNADLAPLDPIVAEFEVECATD